MLFVETTTFSGLTRWRYTISTPTNRHATQIDPKLPTVLFLHPIYTCQEVWDRQFRDPEIRRFNCVAFDWKDHGYTENEPLKRDYNHDRICEDLIAVMEALKLPACHIVGMSMGTIGAIPLAIKRPDLVASLFLSSPLALAEPQDVADGRDEILACWKEGMVGDKTASQDALYGVVQLGYGNQLDGLAKAIVNIAIPCMARRWNSPTGFISAEVSSIQIFTDRTEWTAAELAAIRCPVQLVHGSDDIAYPVSYTQEFQSRLRGGGVKVSIAVIDGAPHWNCQSAKDALVFNPILAKWISNNSSQEAPTPSAVTSPWIERLKDSGYVPSDDEEDDSE
ncbi:alpha/beta-hydrolase [Cylindrobasidium torrendii FP15055 ss-10]|uniref:Alpha/beta-hydrolase n=1 Tax=Cylindrobasidium torrendii FP15055 ss-10 TaxID=1314674 RepID=A0A0D7BBY2_9AGAR|nr:alpha/beta-hydrolase [Cylindrobasidium torrendii FP15055 ss-10]